MSPEAFEDAWRKQGEVSTILWEVHGKLNRLVKWENSRHPRGVESS